MSHDILMDHRDVRSRVQTHGHGHACPKCGGVGTVRMRGRPGGERYTCPECNGSGTLRAGR